MGRFDHYIDTQIAAEQERSDKQETEKERKKHLKRIVRTSIFL